jgi:hypothetical protein
MTAYFSIDVETTSTTPFDGQLCTVGMVVVVDGIIRESLHWRVAYDMDHWDPETKAWWLEQNAQAKAEVFSTKGRLDPETVAFFIQAAVIAYGHPEDLHQNVFVANPVSFDKPWIDRLFLETGIENPFSYRSLCLRSAAWGADESGDWQQKFRTHKPLVPHHALYDAHAQALDLLELLS